MDAITPIMPTMQHPAGLDRFHDARAEGAFKDLEALFVNELLKEMRKSIPDDGLFEKNHARDVYESMLDTVFSEAIAKSGQFGIAKQLAEEIRVQDIQKAVQSSDTVGKWFDLEKPATDRVDKWFDVKKPLADGVDKLFDLEKPAANGVGKLFDLEKPAADDVGKLFDLKDTGEVADKPMKAREMGPESVL